MKRKNKKAQLKIQEMSFMLVAVVILFVLAGLFFVTVKYRELQRTADEYEKEKVISIVAKIADTAEFSCMGSRALCVDTDKLIVMKERPAYSGFWPVTYLGVRRIYPIQEEGADEEIECTKNNYPDCNVFRVYGEEGVGDVEAFSTFVSLCRQEKDGASGVIYEKCELGKIIAGFEPGRGE